MPLAFQIFSSPLGEILVGGTGYAVTHVQRGLDKNQLAADFKLEHEAATPFDRSGYIREACGAIGAYLSGGSDRIEIAVQTDGTEFQRRVWHELRRIPFAQTASYSFIATAIGAPDAFRAVANACGQNPVPLIIPCHRAVHKSGETQGFAWGAKAKKFLLDLERSYISAPAEITA